jgi:hypothetical protein
MENVAWETLTQLLGIPPHCRERFVCWLIKVIECEQRHAAEPPEPSPTWPWRRAKFDADISKTARAFIRAMEQKNRTNLRDRTMIKSVGEYLRHVKKPRRGAPKRAEDGFERFLRYLLYVICFVGGRPTFNRKTGKGNVVELLDELRKHMPPGFIPKWKHPPTMIERLCTEARTARRAVEAHVRGDQTALDRFARNNSIRLIAGD